MERWTMESQPFWTVMAETDALARESPGSVRQLERWMAPNKLTMQEPGMKWRYSLRWKRPGPCPVNLNWRQKWWRPRETRP